MEECKNVTNVKINGRMLQTCSSSLYFVCKESQFAITCSLVIGSHLISRADAPLMHAK